MRWLQRNTLYRIHKGTLYLIEYDNPECENKYGKACSIAKRSPAEFADTEHAELERFHNAGKRVCLHQHFQARVFDGAEWVDYGRSVHPQLYNKGKQEG